MRGRRRNSRLCARGLASRGGGAHTFKLADAPTAQNSPPNSDGRCHSSRTPAHPALHLAARVGEAPPSPSRGGGGVCAGDAGGGISVAGTTTPALPDDNGASPLPPPPLPTPLIPPALAPERAAASSALRASLSRLSESLARSDGVFSRTKPVSAERRPAASASEARPMLLVALPELEYGAGAGDGDGAGAGAARRRLDCLMGLCIALCLG